MSDEAEVEDQFGGKHKVPKKWLAQFDATRDGKVVSVDTYAKLYGPGKWSIGGLGGDAQLGPMPTPGSNERAGVL